MAYIRKRRLRKDECPTGLLIRVKKPRTSFRTDVYYEYPATVNAKNGSNDCICDLYYTSSENNLGINFAESKANYSTCEAKKKSAVYEGTEFDESFIDDDDDEEFDHGNGAEPQFKYTDESKMDVDIEFNTSNLKCKLSSDMSEDTNCIPFNYEDGDVEFRVKYDNYKLLAKDVECSYLNEFGNSLMDDGSIN